MSILLVKRLAQLVVAGVTQPLKLGGISEDGSDAVINVGSDGEITFAGGKSLVPAQAGNTGKFLTTDGETLEWASLGSVSTASIIFRASSTAPTGYLKANGSAISRTTYADLFAVVGTTFGAGDGSTTFNLPDLRAEFLRGLDDGRGIDINRVLGSLQLDGFKSHTHTVTSPSMQGQVGNGAGVFNGVSGTQSYTSSSVGGTETRPRNIALLACIKY